MLKCLSSQFAVIEALILRDVGTRFGRRPMAYVFVLLMPLGQFAITAAIWVLLKRPVPMGGSPLIFFGTGLLPYVVWTFPYRNIALAVSSNRPLLYFSRVKIIDIMIARSILEVLTGFVVVLMIFFALEIMGEDVSPRDPFMTFAAILCAMYFGVAFGMLTGLVASWYPPATTGMLLFSPLMWGLSGAAFMIDTIPSPYREWLAINPLLQCVELIRASYYWNYRSSVLDPFYVIEVSSIIIVLVLFTERKIRGKLLQG